uniref:NADH dehydrogenase subunit 6 n=1 Tax=Acrobeloides nanus TaxID=290746 RepID=A0A914EG72_9BILA
MFDLLNGNIRQCLSTINQEACKIIACIEIIIFLFYGIFLLQYGKLEILRLSIILGTICTSLLLLYADVRRKSRAYLPYIIFKTFIVLILALLLFSLVCSIGILFYNRNDESQIPENLRSFEISTLILGAFIVLIYGIFSLVVLLKVHRVYNKAIEEKYVTGENKQ